MQKRVRRPLSADSASSPAVSSATVSVTSPVISRKQDPKELILAPSISNDNSKQEAPVLSADSSISVRPKIYMSPKKAATKTQASKKKTTRFSAIPIQSDLEQNDIKASKIIVNTQKPTPLLTSSTPQAVSEVEYKEKAADATISPVKQKSGLFFDIKFAVGLIAIVVAVNMVLALLVEKTDDKNAIDIASTAMVTAPNVSKKPSVNAEPVVAPVTTQSQGAVVSNPMSDIEPASGQVSLPALPVALAPKPAAPNLGVVTNAADEKLQQQPKRNLLSIIDQY